jgi:hypothetical protein
MKAGYASFLVAVAFLCGLLVRAQTLVPECGANNGIDFRIVTDKLIYAPKSMMHVKFLITNTRNTSEQDILYLNRNLGYCTSQTGFYALTILDEKNERVPMQGCSGDIAMEKVDAVEMFTNPKSGIALRHGEVFGSDYEFQLPASRGIYHLKAELFTGWLLPKQLQALAERHMRVLQSQQCKIEAPVVTITVK